LKNKPRRLERLYMVKPRIGQYENKRERLVYILQAFAALVEDLVAILTLGCIVWKLRGAVLFNERLEEWIERG
jgi:hypothetical protein